MSNYEAAMNALSNDPELQAKIMAANSAEERKAIFTAAGVALPTHAEVNAHHANLASASGAGAGTTGTATGVGVTVGVPIGIGAAAGAAAA